MLHDSEQNTMNFLLFTEPLWHKKKKKKNICSMFNLRIKVVITPVGPVHTPQASWTGCDPPAIWNDDLWTHTNKMKLSNLLFLFSWVNFRSVRLMISTFRTRLIMIVTYLVPFIDYNAHCTFSLIRENGSRPSLLSCTNIIHWICSSKASELVPCSLLPHWNSMRFFATVSLYDSNSMDEVKFATL